MAILLAMTTPARVFGIEIDAARHHAAMTLTQLGVANGYIAKDEQVLPLSPNLYPPSYLSSHPHSHSSCIHPHPTPSTRLAVVTNGGNNPPRDAPPDISPSAFSTT